MSENDHGPKYDVSVGQYLGEVSALCFLRLPPSLSPLPYLLAGTGSQLLLYDLSLRSANLLRSFPVFDGVRVHGVTSAPGGSSSSSTLRFEIAAFGEKRVKLFSLGVEFDSGRGERVGFGLDWERCLPRFSHWVLDVAFLKSEEGKRRCVAIGCSDNSVRVWDASKSCFILDVQSPERCLLYSMRLWGDSVDDLQIASGTIFNEINIWKVIPVIGTQHLTNDPGHGAHLVDSNKGSLQHFRQQHEAVHISRLVGHEGSIFRIAWSSDGSKLVSVSDDRSARVWTVNAEGKCSANREEVIAGTVLFGHNARVWDCFISASLIITAGEDCTCRLWELDGKQLKMIKEHTGRGVWRCLYDVDTTLLVSAGFDSAIKVHQLSAYPHSMDEQCGIEHGPEIFTCQIPNSFKQVKLMDSKSEYVRCLHLMSEDTLYVATNNGYLYQAKFRGYGDVSWNQIVQVSEGPIICMDVMCNNFAVQSSVLDDWVAVGDGKGKMSITRIIGDVDTPEIGFVLNWSAEKERQLLGVYWCKALGDRFLFTSDPGGNIKLWQLLHPLQSLPSMHAATSDASLVAEFSSSLGFRIMCLDASFDDEVLVCGDLRGNLVIFPFSKSLLLGTTTSSDIKISTAFYFKGAHGISAISSIYIARLGRSEVEIRSTGGDGCICYLELDRGQQVLEFVGMKQVKELSLIQAVASSYNTSYDLASSGYAIGFASTDFIIWNLTTERKVVQVPCGGWRRPHSFYLGEAPDTHHCFAFVKDESIVIHRQWSADSGREVWPLNLHVQFHGRELHSLCFVSGNAFLDANGKHHPSEESSWVATGCEDGTVRLTRYAPGIDSWLTSKLLGEHVGGSAVRSICLVSEMHVLSRVMVNSSDWRNGEKVTAEVKDDPVLLISVGAKRVLTTWLLRDHRPNEQEQRMDRNECNYSSGLSSPLTFKWLSSDLPIKRSASWVKTKCREERGQFSEDAVLALNEKSGPRVLEDGERESGNCLAGSSDDLRYLAVTAFLVKSIGSRLTVCFVVIASSDATLALRALVLPLRLWFDVAALAPIATPVLALQHIVIPNRLCSGVDSEMQNLYLVISGATDGSIAFWDLSESIEAFMSQLLTLDVERLTNHNRRPRTGRGSQGGRWWRSLRGRTSMKQQVDESPALKSVERTMCSSINPAMSSVQPTTDECNRATPCEAICDLSHEPEVKSAESVPEIRELQPLHVLRNVHQSGVNCLHVVKTEDQESSKCTSIFSLASGGDDQALNCIKFSVSPATTTLDSEREKPDITELLGKPGSLVNAVHCIGSCMECSVRFVCHDKITSAHNSAVKGVWTDGTWVFSTGLDQRVRCWLVDEQYKLSEEAHLIISVPEPEALDVRNYDRCYQIAVAGRGMQIVEFCAP